MNTITNKATHYNEQGLIISNNVSITKDGNMILIGGYYPHNKSDLILDGNDLMPSHGLNKTTWKISLPVDLDVTGLLDECFIDLEEECKKLGVSALYKGWKITEQRRELREISRDCLVFLMCDGSKKILDDAGRTNGHTGICELKEPYNFNCKYNYRGVLLERHSQGRQTFPVGAQEKKDLEKREALSEKIKNDKEIKNKLALENERFTLKKEIINSEHDPVKGCRFTYLADNGEFLIGQIIKPSQDYAGSGCCFLSMVFKTESEALEFLEGVYKPSLINGRLHGDSEEYSGVISDVIYSVVAL